MGKFKNMIENDQYAAGSAFIPLTCSATSDWTDAMGHSVSTSTTSGIVKLKSPGNYLCISAAADAAAIVYLPPAESCPGEICVIYAPTAATAGDISVYDETTGAEITTYGDMDADLDRSAFISNGYSWEAVLEVVA